MGNYPHLERIAQWLDWSAGVGYKIWHWAAILFAVAVVSVVLFDVIILCPFTSHC